MANQFVVHMVNSRTGHAYCGRKEMWRVAKVWSQVNCVNCQKNFKALNEQKTLNERIAELEEENTLFRQTLEKFANYEPRPEASIIEKAINEAYAKAARETLEVVDGLPH